MFAKNRSLDSLASLIRFQRVILHASRFTALNLSNSNENLDLCYVPKTEFKAFGVSLKPPVCAHGRIRRINLLGICVIVFLGNPTHTNNLKSVTTTSFEAGFLESTYHFAIFISGIYCLGHRQNGSH